MIYVEDDSSSNENVEPPVFDVPERRARRSRLFADESQDPQEVEILENPQLPAALAENSLQASTVENMQVWIPREPPPSLDSPSKKKRRRSSPQKSESGSRGKHADDDDGSVCTICLDQFHAAGDHRIVSLKCGHIFGESCIRRWIQESAAPKCCPQCKTKTNNRDIRFIYATKIQVEDNSREEAVKLELKELQDRYNTLKNENALNSMQVAVQKAEIRHLKEEIEILKNSCRASTDRATAGIRTIKTCRIYMEKNLDFKENLNSRLIKFMSRNKKLIVSQKSPTSALFSGNGLKLIDFATYRPEKFINACSNVVADFSIDSGESFFVAASKETTCKMYHIPTATSNCSFSPPSSSPIWSCCFDHERPHSLYLGCQNGIVYVYDTRKSTEVFKEISNIQAKSPVKFTIAIKPNASFERGGFFTVHVRGVFFYEYLSSGEIASTTLNINEPVLTMTYDERTEMVLITKGPGGSFVNSRHVLMKLSKEDGIPVLNEIYSFNGTSSNFPDLSRPTQIKVPDGLIVASYLQDTKMLQARSPSTDLLHELHISSDPINDLTPIYIDNTCWFAALSNSRCRMYKVAVGY